MEGLLKAAAGTLVDVIFGKEPFSEDELITAQNFTAFASIDPLYISYDLEAYGDETPDNVQEQTIEYLEQISQEEDACVQFDMIDGALDRVDQLIELSNIIEERVINDKEPEPMTFKDYSESKLDATVILSDRIRNGLKALLYSLVQQLTCCGANHFLRLKLTGFINQTDVESKRLFFDAYLSSQFNRKPPRWTQTKCIISKSGLKEAKTNGCHKLCEAEEDNKSLSILIKETQHAIAASAAQLSGHLDTAAAAAAPVHLDCSSHRTSSVAPTKSLWEFLQPDIAYSYKTKQDMLSGKDKDILYLNLALSLLHLSMVDWKPVNWSSSLNADEGIFFLRDPATDKIIDKAHLYLSYRLNHIPSSQDNSLGCDPQLLDFAKLLLELQRNEVIEEPEDKTQLIVTLLRYCNDLSKSQERFADAIKACVKRTGEEAAKDKKDPSRLSRYIFNEIVRPLEEYAGFPELLTSKLPISLTDSPVAMVEEEPVFDWKREDYQKDTKMASHATDFLNNMDKFVNTYIKRDETKQDTNTDIGRNRKVRIAVIDSGVSNWDPIIKEAVKKGNIKERRNFASLDKKDCDDKVGHGTMVARLLLRIAPEAEIYIAKVTNNVRIPNKELYCIAEAINWAAQKWEVDIITMSLALPNMHGDINLALEEALDPTCVDDGESTRKLVFAAAGNNTGGNAEPAWPARRDGVIAVHATDGLGDGSNINPSKNGQMCFATLGCEIEHEWWDQDDDGTSYISGTSFATPIAAGIAANVMEFARCNIKSLNANQRNRLCSTVCMEGIFEAMSSQRGDYHYVQPWGFWKENLNRSGYTKNGKLIIPGRLQNVTDALFEIIRKH